MIDIVLCALSFVNGKSSKSGILLVVRYGKLFIIILIISLLDNCYVITNFILLRVN